MIFEPLHDSAQRGELLCVDNGFCHFHVRRDGQLTIREIISTRPGAGQRMLRRLMATKGAASLFAKCPADLAANEWYAKRGFTLEGVETTRSGRTLKLWRLPLTNAARPNVGSLEVIYCADGNARLAEIALDAGLLYGARLPSSVAYRPYFVDQDWRAPDRARYIDALAEHRPHMATVLDWERWAQLDDVLAWAEDAARHVQVVVIIPKVHGGIEKLPRTVGGVPVRLGYSVPTRYGGTTVPLHEFAGWPVHLLGGSPHEQIALYDRLRVVSVDTNYTAKLALNANKFWSDGRWRPLECHYPDGPYEAFRRSCVNVMAAWRARIEQPRAGLPAERQLALPGDPRVWAGEAVRAPVDAETAANVSWNAT